MSETGQALQLNETFLSHPAVPRAELAEWRDRYGIVAGITLRGEGFSLGLWTPEPADAVLTRWRAFQASFGDAFTQFVLGHQAHDRNLTWYDRRSSGWLIQDGVDGHATGAKGILLTVTVADCVPIYLLHPETRTMALLHAGWRGTAAGILEAGVSLLSRRAGAEPSELVAHLGVAICGGCYEVGPEVVEAIDGSTPPGPSGLDLRSALFERAEAAGLQDVTTSGWCSAHDEAFFSHRRSRGTDGRMVAYLGCPMA